MGPPEDPRYSRQVRFTPIGQAGQLVAEPHGY